MEPENTRKNPLEDLPKKKVLLLLFCRFFWIALTVIGGGLAILVAADHLFVKKLRWLTEQELYDMYPVYQSVPGLIAGNVAIYVGFRSCGWAGALCALSGVVLPSFLVIVIIASCLHHLPGELPWISGAFIGIRSVMSALTAALLVKLWPKSMKEVYAYPVMLFTFIGMTFYYINPGLLLFLSMIIGVIAAYLPKIRKCGEAGSASLTGIYFLFAYFGILCVGGGSLLISFYINELVNIRHWMSLQELADFMAVSQITPGPIGINLATFIGFRHGGFIGAAAATLGLMTPSFLCMILALKTLSKWEKSPLIRGILAGMRPASIGLIVSVWIVCLELSVFTSQIPWHWFGELLAGNFPAGTGNFSVRWVTLPLFTVFLYLLRRDKCSIMFAIFTGAAYGALLCR